MAFFRIRFSLARPFINLAFVVHIVAGSCLATSASADSVLDLLPSGSQFRDSLATAGIDAEFSLTQFGGALLNGPAGSSADWQSGGKAILKFTIDGSKIGLWEGFYISFIGEMVDGQNVNHSYPGVLLPINTAMTFPADGGFGTDVSVNFTQFFGSGTSLTIGKINMIDAATITPIVGGGGLTSFANIAFAAPPSGLLPAYIFGALIALESKNASYSFAIYDPRNMQGQSGLEDPFAKGVAVMANASFPVSFGGLDGFQNFTLSANNRELIDLSDISDLLLPGGGDGVLESKDGAYYVGYSFQQYLKQIDATHGWGLFGNIGFSDSNPTPLGGGGTLGIAGNSFLAGRDEDIFGVGYFYSYFSDALVEELAPIASLGPESGVEIFYNIHVAPGIRLTADLQLINPAIGDDQVVYGGLRLQAVF